MPDTVPALLEITAWIVHGTLGYSTLLLSIFFTSFIRCISILQECSQTFKS